MSRTPCGAFVTTLAVCLVAGGLTGTLQAGNPNYFGSLPNHRHPGCVPRSSARTTLSMPALALNVSSYQFGVPYSYAPVQGFASRTVAIYSSYQPVNAYPPIAVPPASFPPLPVDALASQPLMASMDRYLNPYPGSSFLPPYGPATYPLSTPGMSGYPLYNYLSSNYAPSAYPASSDPLTPSGFYQPAATLLSGPVPNSYSLNSYNPYGTSPGSYSMNALNPYSSSPGYSSSLPRIDTFPR